MKRVVCRNRQKLSTRLKTMDFNAEYPHDVIFLKTNALGYLHALKTNPRYTHRLPTWALGRGCDIYTT
jgi:hypothetical protein